ncbi:hypothetical protein LAWI1_G007117 [Lachnellula willkommii]|uniref:BTB domain-containing protein n=1 Tax=Lachnellula willkommii TaxID=215461 RepID=A0A559MC72_9HELO|nr:hypothetical protein LAWI1_G007117 [Lachnellula willkommii]
MADQVNGTHAGDVKSNGESTPAEDIQRLAYISALQSSRVTILVGTASTPFQVPQDLLSQHSPILGEKCRSTNVKGTIELPNFKASTFEDFFIWLHVFEPRLGTKSFEAVLDLAILAETYNIYQLRNQTSDLLWREFNDKRWEITPYLLSIVYTSVPSGSLLRQLWVSVLAITHNRAASPEQDNDNLRWKSAFETFPELGWDYFLQMQNVRPRPESVTPGGACRFHDHSDIPSWERQFTAECPYPHGAPAKLPEYDLPIKNSTQMAEVQETNGGVVSEEVLPPPKATLDSGPVPKQPAAMSKKDKKKKNKKKVTNEVENGTLADEISVTSG